MPDFDFLKEHDAPGPKPGGKPPEEPKVESKGNDDFDFDFLADEAAPPAGAAPAPELLPHASSEERTTEPSFDMFDDLELDAVPAASESPAPPNFEPLTESVSPASDADILDFLSEPPATPIEPPAVPSAASDDPIADALGELQVEATGAADFSALGDMTADTTGALSDDPQFSFEPPAANEPTTTKDDPVVDALGELEVEAAGATTFEPLGDMTADTTELLSDDPQFAIEPAASSDEDNLFDFGDMTAAPDAAPTEFAASEGQDESAPASHEPAPILEKTDPAHIAAIVGGSLGMALVAPHEPPTPAWEPPVIPEEPLPPAPDNTDPAYPAYEQLTQHVRQTSLLGSIEAVLGWDERCMMPAAGTDTRAEQITLLSGMIHERLTDPRIGEWLNALNDSALGSDPHGESGTTIRQIRRQFEKRSKLPKALVEELAHTAIMGQSAWQEARKNNDFASFAPILEKMVRLKREQADALGYAEVPYDALLDEFEQGELTSRVTQVLGALRDELVPLVAQIRDSGRSPRVDLLERRYPVEMQRSFGRCAADQIGFDFKRGRLDVTAHPFCTGLGPDDCRITTRYDENYFNSGFFGILHEAGHGIYDQGLRPDQYGLPLGEAVSMGIHESQSRMWEIMVGRGLPFWRHFYGSARRTFPEALGGVTLGNFYFAVNDVRPSLIRVEADEFTYNLHILIRFELEQALISGELSVADLPGAWNAKYRDYLGLEVPNDADGVLQDIHWSAGLFGYFPTYSLGNLYAAQFFEQADKDLGGLDAHFERGEFQYLRKWLNVNIHRHGQRYTAAELVERITGKPLSHEPLIGHLRRKYELLYAPEARSIVELDVADADARPAEFVEEETGGVAMADAGDIGGYGLAAGGFDGMAVGGGTTLDQPATFAPTRLRQRPKSSPFGMIIVFGGIVLGGVVGIGLGLWILMWWKGPVQGDVLKIRDKLPAWMVPAEPAETPEPTPAATPENSGTTPANP